MSKTRRIKRLNESIDRLALEVGTMEELLERICIYYAREQSGSLKGAIEEARILLDRTRGE